MTDDWFSDFREAQERRAAKFSAIQDAAEQRGYLRGLEEAAKVAERHRALWGNAGGFGGHSAGARIIMDEIRALKSTAG